MTRFKKEMKTRFSWLNEIDENGETRGYTIDEKALIVFCHPSITIIYQFTRDGREIEVTDNYPEISAPYLVYLCGGDIDRAKNILKSNGF